MAGSKIFLEPILAETVNGVDGAIQDVITVLDPVPDKIDEQIGELSKVVNIIGSSLNNISITDGNEFSFILKRLNSFYEAKINIDPADPGAHTDTKTESATFHTYVNGTFKITIPAYETYTTIVTNNLGDYANYVSLDYELTRNGTTVKSGNMYSASYDNTEAGGHIDPKTRHNAIEISNITCAANDEFVLTITATAYVYTMGLAQMAYYGGADRIIANYKLVDVVENGIVVQE